MTFPLRTRVLAVALGGAALAFAGCGGDDEKSETVPPAPELTSPADEPTIESTPRTTTSTTSTDAGGGDAPIDQGGGAEVPSADDDGSVTPQQDNSGSQGGSQGGGAGTPQDNNSGGAPSNKFENFCSENPGAC